MERPPLKDPSQPPPFSMTSKLLILHSDAKSYCFAESCVPKVCLIIFSSFTVIICFEMLKTKCYSQTDACKQKQS